MKNSLIFPILFFFLTFPSIVSAQDYWTNLNGPFGGNVDEIKKHPSGNLCIIRNEAAYLSGDNGLTWNEFDNSTLGSNLTMDISPAGVIYLGKSSAGIWWSANQGQSWNFNPIHIAPHSGVWATVITLGISPTNVVYANNWRSFNGGTTFTQFTVAQGAFPYDYAFNPSGYVFTATNIGIFRSNDNGSSWTNISNDLPAPVFNKIVYENENSIYISSQNSGIYRTTNSGTNWFSLNHNLPETTISKIYLNNGKLFAGTTSGKVFVSHNSGNNWTLLTNMQEAGLINSIFEEGSNIFVAASVKGMSYSSDSGVNWVDRNQGLFQITLNDLTFGPGEIFATSLNGMFYSGDNGNSWVKRSSGLPSNFVNTVYKSLGGNIFTSVQNHGIYVSTNNGEIWNESNSGLDINGVFSYIMESDGFFFTLKTASFDSAFLFRSSNNSSHWENVFSANGFFLDNMTIDANGKIFIGGKDESFTPVLHYSSDNGNNWSQINYQNFQLTFQNLTSSGTNLYMVFNTDVLMSTNSGEDWITLNGGWGNSSVSRLAVNSSGDIFASAGNSIYLSTNNGATWVQRFSGMNPSVLIKKFKFNSKGFLFAITNAHGIYRSTQSTITGITITPEVTASDFRLYQNFPNPFNPVTKIRFSIPKSAFVKLNVFDAAGKQVANIVNQTVESGSYEVVFNGSHLSSGVYYYKLNTENFSSVKKMILLK